MRPSSNIVKSYIIKSYIIYVFIIYVFTIFPAPLFAENATTKLDLSQLEINDIQTLEKVQALADKGDDDAAARIGDVFLFGPNNIRHTGYALYYLRRAAARGHLEATEILAGMYLNGNGIDKDPHMAARLYETCAVRGYGPCQFNLGIMYKNGDDDFPQSLEKAYYWLYKASLNEKTLDAVAHDAAEYRNKVGAKLTQDQRMRVFDRIYPRHSGSGN